MASETDLEPGDFETSSCSQKNIQAELDVKAPLFYSTTKEELEPTEVLIVHPSKLYRDCLKRVLAQALDMPVEERPQLDFTDEPTCPQFHRILIVGVDGPSSANWANYIERLSNLANKTTLVVVGNTEDPQLVAELLSKGVRGYLPTSLDLDVWTHALRFILAGGIFAPATCLLKLAKSVNPPAKTFSDQFSLTPKQRLVVEAIRQGKANKTIAYELKMCESTVKVHVRTIMKKLRAKNRTQVAYLANEWLQRMPPLLDKAV